MKNLNKKGAGKTDFMTIFVVIALAVLVVHQTNIFGLKDQLFGVTPSPGTTQVTSGGTSIDSKSCAGFSGISVRAGPEKDRLSTSTGVGGLNVTYLLGGSLDASAGKITNVGSDRGEVADNSAQSTPGNSKVVTIYGSNSSVYYGFAEEYQLNCKDEDLATLSKLGNEGYLVVQHDATPTWTVKGAKDNSDTRANESVGSGGTGSWLISLETSNDQNYGAGATGKVDDWGKLLWVFEMNSTVWNSGTVKFSDTQGSVESRSVPQFYPALAHNALASQVVNTQKAFVTRGTGKKDGAQFIDRFNIAVTAK